MSISGLYSVRLSHLSLDCYHTALIIQLYSELYNIISYYKFLFQSSFFKVVIDLPKLHFLVNFRINISISKNGCSTFYRNGLKYVDQLEETEHLINYGVIQFMNIVYFTISQFSVNKILYFSMQGSYTLNVLNNF